MSTIISYSAYQNRLAHPREHTAVLDSVDIDTWDDGYWADPTFSQTVPEDIDEPWPYRFHSGDHVWIRCSDGDWYRGTIVYTPPRQGRTEWGTGLWWRVEFFAPMSQVRCRKWFAPLNGEVKPDNDHTIKLLAKFDWESEFFLSRLMTFKLRSAHKQAAPSQFL